MAEPFHTFTEGGIYWRIDYHFPEVGLPHWEVSGHREEKLIVSACMTVNHEPTFGIDVEDADNLDTLITPWLEEFGDGSGVVFTQKA